MEIVSRRTNVRISLEDFTCEFRCFMMYEYCLESKGKRARRKRTDDRYLLATLLNISNQHPGGKQCRLPATMPTSKKADMVLRHRASLLEGASPPTFVSYFAYQTFLQTQRARRMAGKASRRRGTRARETQSRHQPKRRRAGALPEMSELRIQVPAPALTPISAPIFSPSSACSGSSTSTVCSTSPATWQLSPLSDVGFEAPSAPLEAESASPPKATRGAKKKYPCDLCDKSFDYKHVLQNHNRTHTGEKPYQCPQCHKRFTRDHHLKTHIRLHTGEKPFGCAVCHKRFVQVANLRRHERVHAGERLHRCGHGHCDAPSDGERPPTPADAEPFEAGPAARRKRHRQGRRSDSAVECGQPRLDHSSSTSMASMAAATGSTNGSDLDFDSREGDGDKSPGSLSMDVGFRLIRNNRYHQRQLDRRYEVWPHLHRLLQPCQEQPEDLSIKK